MSDVIPTGTTPDSDFLFTRMTDVTLDLAGPAPGRRILDVASGAGQDTFALAVRGAHAIGAEPSQRMTGMAQLLSEQRLGSQPPGEGGVRPGWVRGWSDCLPFATGSFDASICKGAIDHFDRPGEAIAEMARVTATSGRVILAIANFESLACRLSRALDELLSEPTARPGRRPYDAPSDHFTRYEVDLMREQASEHLDLELVQGVSLGWGVRGWPQLLAKLPAFAARLSLQAVDAIARRAPSLADVVILAGRPRRSARTSA
jgi:SAM-dependent methyltransferase